MFKKPQRKFNVSTSRVYLVEEKGMLKKLFRFRKAYTKRAVYRSAGTLYAL